MISSCQQCKMMTNGIDHECKYVKCTDKLKSDVYCSEVGQSCSLFYIPSTELSNLKECQRAILPILLFSFKQVLLLCFIHVHVGNTCKYPAFRHYNRNYRHVKEDSYN